MSRILLITNDFPPRPGGIQMYLHALATRLPPGALVVLTSRWKTAADAEFDAAQPFPVLRMDTSVLLPTPSLRARAADLMREHDCTTVWFGAAAPLALLAPGLRKAGARRIIASTHGHEVGWSMLPGARRALRAIGEHTDVITYISPYTRHRFSSALGATAALEYLPPGVDTSQFRPDPLDRARLRARYRLGERPVILCLSRLVARKGQDRLIAAMPVVRAQIPGATLVLAGAGPGERRLRALADRHGVSGGVIFTGQVSAKELAAHHNIADVFALPSRTRLGGLDVEGLGIACLEAAATGVAVLAGRSGGAPGSVRDGETGMVVDGQSAAEIAAAASILLADPARAARMGAAGRSWMVADWQWDARADRLWTLALGSTA